MPGNSRRRFSLEPMVSKKPRDAAGLAIVSSLPSSRESGWVIWGPSSRACSCARRDSVNQRGVVFRL